MEKKRLWQQLCLLMIPGSKKRVEYLKKNHVFHECGENVYLQSRKIPLYANLISLHDDIRIASDVTFVSQKINAALDYVILTHEYADRLCGLNAIRKKSDKNMQ